MPNLSDVTFNNLYCLFKGEPGTRKSTCALSFPRPQYWFSWDRKMGALILPMKQWGINPTEVEYDNYSDWDKVKSKLESLKINSKYKTVVIDSITSGSDAINRQTLITKGGSKKVGTIAVNSIEDFNAEDSALKELIALTKSLNEDHKMNVILIAHVIQKEIKTPDGQTHMSRILLTAGKGIAQKIPIYCDETYHFNIKMGAIVGAGGTYTLFTQHTGDDFARTALPLDKLIEFGDQPLYDKWLKPAIDKMKGGDESSQRIKLIQPNT